MFNLPSPWYVAIATQAKTKIQRKAQKMIFLSSFPPDGSENYSGFLSSEHLPCFTILMHSPAQRPAPMWVMSVEGQGVDTLLVLLTAVASAAVTMLGS